MERSRKSRTECFLICLPCSCCEYGKSSLEMAGLEVRSWEEPSLSLGYQSFPRYPSSTSNLWLALGVYLPRCVPTELSPQCSVSFPSFSTCFPQGLYLFIYFTIFIGV